MGTVFIDFQEAFDCVSHSILLHNLEHNFTITENLLTWLRDYLSEREQYTLINGVPSENTKVAHGIPQGSVLGVLTKINQNYEEVNGELHDANCKIEEIESIMQIKPNKLERCTSDSCPSNAIRVNTI